MFNHKIYLELTLMMCGFQIMREMKGEGIAPSVRIVVTPIENTNDRMGTEREAYFTRT